MFEALTNKLGSVLRNLSGRGRISEENVRDAMQEVRTALLEADVSYKVVKDFCDHVLAKAQGQEVYKSLRPGDLMVKIVYDELVALMGPVDTSIYFVSPGPTIIMMCGLQGSGKTTTCGKLAKYLLSKGRQPMLCAADLQRPAAIEQLRIVGEQAGVPVYTDPSRAAEHGQVARGAAVAVCRAALAQAKAGGRDVLILDTAGRLAIDDQLMEELKEINGQLKPHQIYLVLDAMTGQDAVNSARIFNEKLELDGLILTKFDSDTRGGALLSAKVITGKPVKFLGMGEKLEALEEFRPEGMAQRILGMGDVVALVNTVMEKADQEEAARIQARMEQGKFTLDDFMSQLNQVTRLGPLGKIMGMIPGMSQMTQQFNLKDGDIESQLGQMRAIYNSMNKAERKNTDLLDSSRRRRIARGAGVDLNSVGHFMKQFDQCRDMMKAVGSMGVGGKLTLMRQLMSGKLNTLGMPGGPTLRTKKSGHMEKKERNRRGRR
jgi:signal recognition particle subunit SRP54